MSDHVTIDDIARELGLSKAAVSYALNERPGVSKKTRARVLAHAAERGWAPNQAARALSGAQVGVIGVALTRPPVMVAEEPYYNLMIAGIENVLIEADVSLMLRMVGAAPGADEAVYRRWLRERRVDGVILFDGTPDDYRPALLTELECPFVTVGFEVAGHSAAVMDSVQAAELIVGEFSASGATSILHVTGPTSYSHEVRREAAIRAKASEAGLACRASHGDYTLQGGREAALATLREDASIDGIISSNDVMALGVLMALHELDLVSPDDVALMSWDESVLSRSAQPPITALNRSPLDFGALAATLLLDEIAGEPPRVEYRTSTLTRAQTTLPRTI